MATRIKDGEVPYTGGIGIEITNNHVINVLLRELNNLIHVNEDRELYVDLQLDDGIEPDDDFPVGITTGRILQEDGRPQNGLIINRKTTSGDYTRLITAADGKFYVDLGDGVWRLLGGEGGGACDCNVKRFIVRNLDGDETVGQQLIDWYLEGKYPIIEYNGASYILESRSQTRQIRFYDIHTIINNYMEDGFSNTTRKVIYASWDSNNEFLGWLDDEINVIPNVLAIDIDYDHPYTPRYNGSPTTKKYVDDGLALKQDKIIAGNNITINADGKTINATIPQALVYKGSVTGLNDLPSSGQTVGDTYFVEGEDAMYSWDGTQWSYVGGTGIDVTNLFNKTIDDSDDITEGSIHLFCTSSEKTYWNGKQDPLTAGDNIQISNNVISATDTVYYEGDGIDISNSNVISNTAKFEPENAGSLGQFLKKTSTGYSWANIPGGGSGTTYTAGDGINISSNNVISATDRFTPTNTGSTGQVLKKSGPNSYYWANESGGGGGGETYYAGSGIEITNDNVINNTKPFDPSTAGSNGQVLTKTANGYDWTTITAGEGNVKLFTLSSTSDTTTAQAVLDWTLAGKMPIIKLNNGTHDVYYWLNIANPVSEVLEFKVYMGPSAGNNYTYQVYEDVFINYSGTTVSNITWQREELNKTWNGTQAQYNLITPEQGVVYNIIPSS